MTPTRCARLLVVDDDPRNRRLVSTMLAAEGYRIDDAADGEQALAAADREAPDLVLLDVMMPGLDGFAVCRRLRESAPTRDVPVLLLTALADVSDKVRGLDAGADDFLTKPVDRLELVARVRTHLRIKGLRDEAIASRESLARQNHRLLALERAREDLANMLVHDLKSPLASIRLLVDFLAVLPEPEARDRLPGALAHIGACAERLEWLVGDILDVARLEQARLEPRLVAVDWRVMVERSLAPFLGAGAGPAPVTASVHPPGAASLADPHLLARVIQNLVANAVARNGTVEPVRVEVEVDAAGTATIAVSDRGPGVPEGLREAIFDKFASLDGRGGAGGNHGLGLTFCKLAVEAHGGAIAVEPRPGGGSRFVARLPARAASASRAATARDTQRAPALLAGVAG